MNRLTTRRNPTGWPEKWPDMYELVACDKDPEWCEDWKDQHECKCDAVGDCINRLGSYEDIGLTPEEIAAIRAENEHILAVNLELRKCDTVNEKILRHVRAEVERLRATYEAPPMPLTADDLARMEGEPVYVRYGDGREGWDHVEDGMPIWLEADPDFLNLTCSFDKDGHFGLHVLGWQAFRCKPDVANAELGKDGAQ